MDSFRLHELLTFTSKNKIAVKVVSHKHIKRVKLNQLPLFLVVHYGRSDKNGHYIGFVIHKSKKRAKTAIMLDSFGEKYSYYSTVVLPFSIKGGITRQIQDSSSNLCGLFLWFFLHRLVENYSVRATLGLFGRNTLLNDKLVKERYKQFIAKNNIHFKSNLSPRFYCTCKNKFVKINR